MVPVDVVILTKEEEENIRGCVRSVSDFVTVWVVDSASKDRTVDIAREEGARVLQFEWDGGYPKKKQWCLQNISFNTPWVLYLDADELMTEEAAREIAEAVDDSDYSGYFLEYSYSFLGKRLEYGRRLRKLALLKHKQAYFADHQDLDVARMWEVEGHYQPVVDGSVGTINARLIHEDDKDLYYLFERYNIYSDWEAKLRAKGKLRSVEQSRDWLRRFQHSVFDRLLGRPAWMFLYSYVFSGGFLDGAAGFRYAQALAVYYTMIDLKLCEERESQ